jgi:hypothetical protein
MYVFDSELFRTMAVQQGQHVAAVGCHTFFSGLISVFVFDILQILSESRQICSGRFTRTCTPPPHTPIRVRAYFQNQIFERRDSFRLYFISTSLRN